MRLFAVYLYGTKIDTVGFIGEEYTESTVKTFLMENDKMSRDIEVKQIREVVK